MTNTQPTANTIVGVVARTRAHPGRDRAGFEVRVAHVASFLDATGLPFVFDTQLLEGTVPTQTVVKPHKP